MDVNGSEKPVASRPRVMLLGSSVSGGGAENRFRLLGQSLFGGTAAVAVLYGDLSQMGFAEGAISLGHSGPRSYPGVLRRLRAHIRAYQPDVILSLGFYPNWIAYFSSLGLRSRPRLVMTEITRPHRETMEVGSRLRRFFFHGIRRLIYPRATLFGANSIDGIEEAIRYYGVQRVRTRRLHNLVDIPEIERRAASSSVENTKRPVICISARLDHMKRVDTLLTAASMLGKERPWSISVVGDGHERKALEAQASALGIADRVDFQGWQSNPHPLVADADVFVLCSEYEGFSNAVVEAMALKTPVVTSFCSSDAREMSKQGAVLGFEVGDAEALSRHLAALLDDPALRARIAQAGWDYVQAHSCTASVADYEALICDAAPA